MKKIVMGLLFGMIGWSLAANDLTVNIVFSGAPDAKWEITDLGGGKAGELKVNKRSSSRNLVFAGDAKGKTVVFSVKTPAAGAFRFSLFGSDAKSKKPAWVKLESFKIAGAEKLIAPKNAAAGATASSRLKCKAAATIKVEVKFADTPRAEADKLSAALQAKLDARRAKKAAKAAETKSKSAEKPAK